ncbi:fungal pheromone STE3G-protein-coupled receptor, partial [Coniophora puteana RWD-64-598 SS2]
AWNAGSVAYILWTGIMCFSLAVNSIVWNGNIDDSAPVWCNISSRLLVAGPVAIPAATLCINRRLHQILILKYKRTQVSKHCRCPLQNHTIDHLPHYVVQTNRYAILQDIGCYAAVGPYNANVPSIYALPLMLTIASTIYSCLAIRAACNQRPVLAQVLALDGSRSLTATRFQKLIILSFTQAIFQSFFSISTLVVSIPQSQTGFWPGWALVHANMTQVEFEPPSVWGNTAWSIASVYLFQWTYVVHAFCYFVLLGFTPEAKVSY